jgi:hypothetical protein
MICDVSDPQATQQQPSPAQIAAQELRPRWWSRPSPWFWGLVVLLLVTAIVVTQVPRLSAVFSARGATNNQAAPAIQPTLAGPAYTQAMVAGRNFTGANLSGARLVRLDLRGKSFQHADAAGVVFAGSLLNGVNFSHADLRGADLRGTCLRGADFTGADLAGADFTNADVTGATVALAAISSAIGWASGSASSVCPLG